MGNTVYTKVSGSYKQGVPYVKINGTWKKGSTVYVKVNGSWETYTPPTPTYYLQECYDLDGGNQFVNKDAYYQGYLCTGIFESKYPTHPSNDYIMSPDIDVSNGETVKVYVPYTWTKDWPLLICNNNSYYTVGGTDVIAGYYYNLYFNGGTFKATRTS